MSFLQGYLKHILVLSQCFGILPLSGVYSDSARHLKFTWLSWRVGYSLCLATCTLFSLGMGCYHFWVNDFELSNLTTIIFFLNGLIVISLFLKLAREWPDFIHYWEITEIFIRSKIIAPCSFCYIACAILGAATVEHGLLIVYSMTSERKSQNGTNGFEHFMTRDLYIFKYINYTWYWGMFIKFISFTNTFYWNFMDVFIIAISNALTTLIKSMNDRIRITTEIKPRLWVDLRKQYNKLYKLSFQVEEKISPIILMSFSSNLYFILVQLHGSVKKRRSAMESVYFFFSFGLLLLRTSAVCLFAANVDDESKMSLKLLSCLDTYNVESELLLQQITSMRIAFTGMNFFTITRQSILSIAAAIVTYELFFIQYINTIED